MLYKPTFYQSSQVELAEIHTCLQQIAYLCDSNLSVCSTLHMSVSTSIIELDQVLPSRLESYMIEVQQQHSNWPDYISKMSFEEIEGNKVEYENLKEFAKPVAISLKEEKQYQLINCNSNIRIGFQQKKSDGLLSNQILNSKIQRTRSTSPIPSIFNTNSQIPPLPPLITYAESEMIVNTANQSSLANPLNDTHQSNYQISKWTEPIQNQKILFQDNFLLEDDNKKASQIKQNVIVVKKSEDPMFFEQLKKARVASPKIVRQVKGSGISPEPYKTSKSPEPIQVTLPNNQKKFEIGVSQKQSQTQQSDQRANKISEQFKKLQMETKQRSINPKPFSANNTKYHLSQQTLKQKVSEQQLQDSLNNRNPLKVVQSERQFTQNVQEVETPILQSEPYGRNKSQNKKQMEDTLFEQLQTQHQSIRDQFSFKPEPQTARQLIESRSQRGISPQNRQIQFQQMERQQQQQPIQIKLDIKQFMNSNKTQQRSVSPLQRQQINVVRDNGQGLMVNLNFKN